MKRPALIVAGVIVVLLVLAAVYFAFFRNTGPQVVDGPTVPFTTSDDYVPGSGTVEEQPLGQIEGKAGDEIAPKLIRITRGPVADGFAVFPVSVLVATGSTTASGTPLTSVSRDTEVRYLERASGNAYAYRSGARSLARISNRTLPGLYEAAWLSDGSLAYARFLSEGEGKESIETFALPIGESEGGYFLEPNLSDVIVRGTTTVATLLPSTAGSIATVAAPSGENVRTAFSSPLSNLRMLFLGSDLVAYTKASAQMGGYAFLVNRSTGAFERIAGPSRGLTALPSPRGSYVFLTYLSGNTLRSELIDMEDRISTSIPLGALSEKCAWAEDERAIYCAVPRSVEGAIPDDWYQGAVSFSDRIWRIDLEGRVAVLVVDPASVADVAIDAVSLTVDSEGKLLVFKDKKTGSLWAYSL